MLEKKKSHAQKKSESHMDDKFKSSSTLEPSIPVHRRDESRYCQFANVLPEGITVHGRGEWPDQIKSAEFRRQSQNRDPRRNPKP